MDDLFLDMYYFFVLIETYWNVKSFLITENFIETTVLIETYWNVKKQFEQMSENRVEVLIETYWNVKDGTSTFKIHGPYSINRNILECKVTF